MAPARVLVEAARKQQMAMECVVDEVVEVIVVVVVVVSLWFRCGFVVFVVVVVVCFRLMTVYDHMTSPMQ